MIGRLDPITRLATAHHRLSQTFGGEASAVLHFFLIVHAQALSASQEARPECGRQASVFAVNEGLLHPAKAKEATSPSVASSLLTVIAAGPDCWPNSYPRAWEPWQRLPAMPELFARSGRPICFRMLPKTFSVTSCYEVAALQLQSSGSLPDPSLGVTQKRRPSRRRFFHAPAPRIPVRASRLAIATAFRALHGGTRQLMRKSLAPALFLLLWCGDHAFAQPGRTIADFLSECSKKHDVWS